MTLAIRLKILITHFSKFTLASEVGEGNWYHSLKKTDIINFFLRLL